MKRKNRDLIEFALLAGIILFVNIICSEYFFRADLTEDQRYSTSSVAKQMLGKLEDNMYVDVYLDGDMDPDFERLKNAIKQKLESFKAYSGGKIQYNFIDPNEDPNEATRMQLYRTLGQQGIKGFNRVDERNGQRKEVVLFPGALVTYKDKTVPVNFYKGNSLLPVDQLLNQSVEGIEFEFLSSIRKLTNTEFKSVAYIIGHGETGKAETYDIVTALSENYTLERVTIDSVKDLSRFACVIVAQPQQKYSDRDKFILDQYVVKGGQLLVLMDGAEVRQDSLKGGETFALNKESNLDDLFFKWGVRLNQDVIMDMQSSGVVKVITGANGEAQLLNFQYYPIVHTFSKHPLVRNMDAIYTRFVGSIDTVKAAGIVKTPLMMTSGHVKTINAPMQIDLDALRMQPDPDKYDKAYIPVAYLLEGNFKSLYAQRPAPVKDIPVVKEGKGGRVIICSDGDLLRNEIDLQRKMPLPLGFDAETRYTYSNKDFLLNAIDYLTDAGIINVRSKEIVLRPLDKVRIVEEKLTWQIVNLLIPILLIVAFGVARFAWRKKKYAKF